MTVLPRRPLRGSRISSFYPVDDLPSISSLDSAFQLQEYISLLIRLDIHDVEGIVSLPGRCGNDQEKEKAENTEEQSTDGIEKKTEEAGKTDATVDEACWIYEQLRRLAQDLSHPLITMLQQECTRASCPEMKAGEWLYLCVAHGNEGAMEQCCAIDYILHTLDSATALLNTPRAFPSRLQIPPASHRHFSSLARRLGRIFAHAYFHHREAFELAEAESSLYSRFLALTSKFDLVPSEFLVIPQRTSNDEDTDESRPPEISRGTSAASHSNGQILNAAQYREEDQWNRSFNMANNFIRRDGCKDSGLIRLGGESPKKLGRSRTDTMVLHEGFAFVEELARSGAIKDPEDMDGESITPDLDPTLREEGEATEYTQQVAELSSSPTSDNDSLPPEASLLKGPPKSEDEGTGPPSEIWEEVTLDNVSKLSPVAETQISASQPLPEDPALSPSSQHESMTALRSPAMASKASASPHIGEVAMTDMNRTETAAEFCARMDGEDWQAFEKTEEWKAHESQENVIQESLHPAELKPSEDEDAELAEVAVKSDDIS